MPKGLGRLTWENGLGFSAEITFGEVARWPMIRHRENHAQPNEMEPQVPPSVGTTRRAILGAPLMAAFFAMGASPAAGSTMEQAVAVPALNGFPGEVAAGSSADASTAALLADPDSLSRAALTETIDGKLAPAFNTTTKTVSIYVDKAKGNDATGVGASGAPFATIQRAFDSIPKVITNDYRVKVAPGRYAEEARLQGVGGSAVVLELWGTPPASAAQSSGLKVRALAFYDISGRVVVNHVDLIEAAQVTRRAQILFSRVDYASARSIRATADTRAADSGAGIPALEYDGSGGSVGSNYFNGQYVNVAIRNGSNVRLDPSNDQGGTPSGTAVIVEAATAYKAAPVLPWTARCTVGEATSKGGVYQSAWTNWSPSFPSSGGLVFGSTKVSHARYQVVGNTCHFVLRVSGKTRGRTGTSLQFTLPVKAYFNSNAAIGNAIVNDRGFDAGWMVIANNTTVQVRKVGQNNRWTLGSDRRFYVSGSYEIA